MLSAAGFLYLLIKGLTEPLNRAVGLAESIASGDLKGEKSIATGRDLGDLISALLAMRESLSTAFQELEKSKARLANAQLIARIGDWEVHLPDGAIVVSEGIAPIIGHASDQLSWHNGIPVEIVHPEDRPVLERAIRSAHRGGVRFSHDFRIVRSDGEHRYVHSQMEVVHDVHGSAIKLSGTLQDITDRKNAEMQIEYLALHDSLTGLPNRRLFTQESNKIIAISERLNQQAALLYMDLDRFKNVNDSLGHHIGDALLIEVTQRLSKCLRKSDYLSRDPFSREAEPMPANIVARLGGDEFTILLANLQHTDDAARVAQRILYELSVPFKLDGKEVFISVASVLPCTRSMATMRRC
jgi:PAS domain S-box-containing protein